MEAFKESSDLRCVALNVEGRKLYVCPQRLADQSLVFESLFFGKLREQANDFTVLKGKSLKSFIPFLQCLSGTFEEIMEAHKSEPVEIWKLADEYGVLSLKKYVERFLISVIIPNLKANEVQDKEKMMEVLIAADEIGSPEVYKDTFDRVLSLDLAFIKTYRKKMESNIYADLLEAKLVGVGWYTLEYHNIPVGSQSYAAHGYPCALTALNHSDAPTIYLRTRYCPWCKQYLCDSCAWESNCSIRNVGQTISVATKCTICHKIRSSAVDDSCLCYRKCW